MSLEVLRYPLLMALVSVPNGEDPGMLMLSVCIVLLVLAGRGGKGAGRRGREGSYSGAVVHGQETSKDGDLKLCTKSRHSK